MNVLPFSSAEIANEGSGSSVFGAGEANAPAMKLKRRLRRIMEQEPSRCPNGWWIATERWRARGGHG